MFFTQDDYKKIQQWLTKNSVKDTEFNEANIPFNGEETITIVQDNQNKKVFLKDLIAQVFNLGISDFINITDKYNAPNISLEEAIKLIPSRARKEGQVITFSDIENHWYIYQFKGTLNQWNILDQWSDLFKDNYVNSILPDEEDLTKSSPDENGNSYLSFKDKRYNKLDFSGLGRVYLRKNIVNGKNILIQDIMGKENTRYIIQYDYDLDGSTLSIPEGSVLDFQGGSFKNGTIIGNNTIIVNGDYQIFGNGITIDGTWVNPFTLEQFGANTNLEDNRESIERFNFSKVSKVNLLGIYRTSIGINIVCNEGEEKDVVIYSNSNGGIVHSIDRWGSVPQQYAVHVTRAKSVRINGINIEKEVRYKELVDNTYSATNSYCIVIEQSAQGSININDTDGIWVENCRLIDNCGVPNTVNGKSFYGMIWIGNYFGKCKNISVCNNIIEKPHGRIVYMSESSEINISQNKIIGVDHNYNLNTCSDLTTIVFRILSCKNIDVHDNYISYNTDYSASDFVSRVFHISANDLAFAPSENCNVSNNIVDVKSSTHEIRLCTSEACLRLNIKSNKFILGSGTVRIAYFNNTLDWSKISSVILESNEIYNYNNHMFMCAGSWIPMTLRNNNFYNDDSSLSSNYVNIHNYSESTDSNKIINEGSRLFLSGNFVKIMSINNAQHKNDFSETPDYLTNVSTLVKSKGLTGVSGIKGRVYGLRVVGARYLPVAKGEASLYECFNGIGERIIDSSMNISDIVAIMQEQPCVTVCGNIDLNGKTVNLRANGTLRIIFGTISNGVIIGNNTHLIVNGALSAGITATKQGVWIWENNKFKVGNTSYRPSLDSSDKGFLFFDTELSKPIWWNGSEWVDATGVTV